MKKILMLLLGAMLVLSMAGVVSAEENPITFNETHFSDDTDKQTADVTVTLTLQEAYEVTIPANVVLTEHSHNGVPMYSGTNWLNATVHLMPPGTGLLVNITGKYADAPNPNRYWNLTPSSGTGAVAQYIIGYTTSPSEHIERGSVSPGLQVLGIKDAGMEAKLCMHYKLVTPLSQLSTTETYTDTLTFGVYVVSDRIIEDMDSKFLRAIS